MAKLQAQLAALLGKEQAGTITDAEAKDLAALRAMLAMDEEDSEGDGDEEAEGGDEDANEDEDAEDEEAMEDEDAEDDEGASARADEVLNHAAAKGRSKLAGKLAVRVAAGKETVKGAIDLLEASGKEAGDFGAAAARTPDGVKPGARGNQQRESSLVAAAKKAAGIN